MLPVPVMAVSGMGAGFKVLTRPPAAIQCRVVPVVAVCFTPLPSDVVGMTVSTDSDPAGYLIIWIH